MLYGFFASCLYNFIKGKKLYIFIYFILTTLFYILIMYKFNNGVIHYILKICLILGFYLQQKSVNIFKKSVNIIKK